MRRTLAALLVTGLLTTSMPLMARGDRGGRDSGGDFPIVRIIKRIIRILLPLDDTGTINPPKP